MLLLSLLLSPSCGSSGRTSPAPPRTPAGNYAITVLASSPNITHQIGLRLTVQ
jgi:hypothetical protein